MRNDADREAVEAYCAQHGMPVIGVVPFEEQFVAAEQAAQAPADYADGSPGLRAIEAVADRVVGLGARAPA